MRCLRLRAALRASSQGLPMRISIAVARARHGARARCRRCGVPMVTTRWKRHGAGRRAPARHGSPARPCCAPTSTGAIPVAPRAGRPPTSIVSTYRSIEPNAGSRVTATKGMPSPRSRCIQGFHKPRLQKKPWTRTTPRRPRASAGTKSATAAERNGWRQQENARRDQRLHRAMPRATGRIVGRSGESVDVRARAARANSSARAPPYNRRR